MKKFIIDEKTGLAYTLVGDYYIPNITIPEPDKRPIRQPQIELYRNVGQKTSHLSQRTSPGTLQQTRSPLQTAQSPCRCKRAGNRKT